MRVFIKSLISASAVVLTATFAATSGAAESGRSVLPNARPAHGIAEQKPSLGVFAGLADTSEGHKNGANYGIEYGFQPYIPMATSLELSGYVSGANGTKSTLTRTRLLLKANYNFGGDVPVVKYSYIGAGLGPVLDNQDHATTIDLGVAPQIGFDIPWTTEVAQYSIGANANYMFVGGAKPAVFSLNGVIKYWF